jgi:hypothetical protein
MKPMAEIWKPMPDWEGEYEISNLARLEQAREGLQPCRGRTGVDEHRRRGQGI